MDVVVDVLQRHVSGPDIRCELPEPFRRRESPPSPIVVGREHAIDSISQGSWLIFVPVWVLFLEILPWLVPSFPRGRQRLICMLPIIVPL